MSADIPKSQAELICDFCGEGANKERPLLVRISPTKGMKLCICGNCTATIGTIFATQNADWRAQQIERLTNTVPFEGPSPRNSN